MGELDHSVAEGAILGTVTSKVIGDFTLPAITSPNLWNGTLSEPAGNFDAIYLRVFPNTGGGQQFAILIGSDSLSAGALYPNQSGSGFYVKADDTVFYGFFGNKSKAEAGGSASAYLNTVRCGVSNKIYAGAATIDAGVRIVVIGIKF